MNATFPWFGGLRSTSFGCARAAAVAGHLALMVLVPSCGAADWSVLHPTSHVTCKWSIAMMTNAASCASARASNVHIAVYLAGNNTGLFDHQFDAPCTDFVTSMELLPGGYYAFATLEDGTGQPRGVVARIHPFNADQDTDVSIGVDFPKTSLYP